MANENMNIKQIRGITYWAQILGDPRPNYDQTGKEWSIDVSIDEATQETLKKLGLEPKFKNKGDDRGTFITFKRAAIKKAGPLAGKDNSPIRVVNPDGKTEWDRSVKIGNGSVVNVRFSVNENVGGPGKKKFVRADVLSIQVWEHKAYVAPEGKEPRGEFEQNENAEPVKAVVNEW